jgi:hypothetical protein
MIMLILIVAAVSCLTVVYMVIKKKGRDEVINKINNKVLKNVKEARKRDIEHANDSMDDVSKRLCE